MGELINKKYLDFGGLQKYDELIKKFIATGNNELAAAIAALDAKIGNLDVEGSDGKNLAEIVNDIYASIDSIIAKQGELDAKDTELEGKINDIIGDLGASDGSDAVMTLVEISNKLKALDASVLKNTQDIASVTERVAVVEAAIEDLGSIEGGENLGSIVNKVNANAEAIATLKGEGEGSVKKAADDARDAAVAAAKEYADGLAGNYDAAGTAAGLDAAMDVRVKALEAIDHDKIAADAIAAVVAGAESDFDTLKEVADWIASDKEGSAALQTTVSNHTESINKINGDIDALDAKVDVDIANLTTHMSEASTALAEVDSRLDALEAFEETHASIEIADIEGLFA